MLTRVDCAFMLLCSIGAIGCGGSSGETCSIDSDCASGFCKADGTCGPAPVDAPPGSDAPIDGTTGLCNPNHDDMVTLAEFFSRYVTGALDLYLQAKRGVQTLATYNPLTQIPMAASDALTRMWMGGFYNAPPPGYPVAPPPPAAEPEEDTEPSEQRERADDVAEMRRELDELKQALRDSLPKRKKRKP